MPVVIRRRLNCIWEEPKSRYIYMMFGVLSIMWCFVYIYVCITFDARGLKVMFAFGKGIVKDIVMLGCSLYT